MYINSVSIIIKRAKGYLLQDLKIVKFDLSIRSIDVNFFSKDFKFRLWRVVRNRLLHNYQKK